jgi:hypothetical protein
MSNATKYASWGPTEGASAAVRLQSKLFHGAYVRLSNALKSMLAGPKLTANAAR